MTSAAWLVQRLRVIVDPALRRRALVTILTTSEPAVVVLAADDLLATAIGADDPDLAAAWPRWSRPPPTSTTRPAPGCTRWPGPATRST